MAETTSPRSIEISKEAYSCAKVLMPGGVSSPVCAFKAVGGTPLFVKHAQGCEITDLDGNVYIDYVGSYGPMIVGHANERVVTALCKAIGRGTSYGAPTEFETDLAGTIVSALPSMEMVRFVNSGTEATMSAIAPGARSDEARPDRQMHRLLSRPRRWPARAGRKRRADARHAEQPRRARDDDAQHGFGRVQRPGGRKKSLRTISREDRSVSGRAGRGQHGCRSSGTGISARTARTV